jgi:hypothetical protein
MTIKLTLDAQTLSEGQTTSGASFVASVTDSAGRAISEYAVSLSGVDGGYFALGGVKLLGGQWCALTAAQFAQLQYVAGSTAGGETISVMAYDGSAWSAAYSTTATTTVPLSVTAASQAVSEGATLAASSLIASTSVPGGKSITEYALMDSGTDGHLVYGGTTLKAATWYDFTAAQLAEVSWVAGSSVGTDKVSIEVSDGGAFTAASTATLTADPPPTVTAASQSVSEGKTLSASSLIASASDPAGKSIAEYALMDSGTDGTLDYNGVALKAGTWYDFTAAQLARVTWVAGSSVGTDKVSIEVSDGGAFSVASTATLTVQVPSAVSLIEELGVSAATAQSLTAGNAITYNGMLTILQTAANGGMTATKFSALRSLAAMLNQPGGLTTSAYVQQIADDVIVGNSANADWNGGSSTATALGNLSATSTQTQVDELIGKWFLGTDLPSLSVSAIGETNLNPTYQNSTLALFGASGSPSYLDVNQGDLGDCYFVSALGETALQDPSLIKNMIQSDGNGAYSVEFYVNGQPDYVTVNGELPVMGGNVKWADGSGLEFANGTSDDWVALIEKAFVQLNEQTAAASYGGHTAGDAYEDVNGGTAISLSEITDQTFNAYNLSATESSSTLSSLMSTLSADFKAGDEIILSTPNANNGNLVGDHMYMITGINASAGAISIQNPWNTAYSGSLQMSFTDTIAQLAADNVSLYATTGTKVA